MAFTMYCVRYGIIYPLLTINQFSLPIPTLWFHLMVLGSLLIAAAGYLINDYFDVKIDMINKPEKTYVGLKISRLSAISLHLIMTFAGFILFIPISHYTSNYSFMAIPFIASGLLWFYSTTFKCQGLIGNFIISFLAALVPFSAGIYDMYMMYTHYIDILCERLSITPSTLSAEDIYSYKEGMSYLFSWIAAYTLFSFLTTLIRELTKDMEDYEGDAIHNCSTYPVKYGLKRSKQWLYFFLLVLGGAFLYFQIQQYRLKNLSLLYYGILFIEIPSLIFAWLIYKAEKKEDFHRASTLMKAIMLAGVCYLILFRIIVLR